MKMPRIEDLAVPQLIEQADRMVKLGVDEVQVRMAMHPMRDAVLGAFFIGSMASTAVLFVLDPDESAAAIASAGEAPLTDLPPLPFARVAVEAVGDRALFSATMADGHRMDIDVLTLNESARGEQWDCAILVRETSGSGEVAHRASLFQVHRDKTVVFIGKGDGREPEAHTGELGSPTGAMHRRAAIELAHLLNARGVTVTAQPIPRGQRRRFEKKKLVHPRVYFVVIGDGTSDASGVSDRVYTCRWLVRGHWRHHANGTRTWIRPYIKGPAGAPWRGRPIYITEKAAAA